MNNKRKRWDERKNTALYIQKSAHLRKSTVEEVSRLYTRFSGHRFERVDSLERGKHKAATTLDGTLERVE